MTSAQKEARGLKKVLLMNARELYVAIDAKEGGKASTQPPMTIGSGRALPVSQLCTMCSLLSCHC